MKLSYILLFKKNGTNVQIEVRADQKNADRLRRQLIADKEVTDFIFTPKEHENQITEN